MFCVCTAGYLAGHTLLFDLETDLFEEHDLAAANQEVVKRLLAWLHKYNPTHCGGATCLPDPGKHWKGCKGNATFDPQLGSVWLPWREDATPATCDTNRGKWPSEKTDDDDASPAPAERKHVPPLLPGAPLQVALQAAVDAGDASFTVPAGEYNFSSTPLKLFDATSLDISAYGVTLWFSPGGGVVLKDASDVSIKGLTIDYTPTVAQGVVVSVDKGTATPSIVAKFDPLFLGPLAVFEAAGGPCKVGFWSPDERLLVRNKSAPAAVNIYTPKVEAVNAATHTYRVFVHDSGPHGSGLAEAGQLVNVFHGHNSHSYTSINCSRITLEDVNIWGGTGMGIVDGQGGGGSTYRRVQLTRRPLMRGVGVVALTPPYPFRLQSTNEDGFHSNGNNRGPTIVDSVVAFNGDDNGNICAGMSVLLTAEKGQLLMMDAGHNLPRGRAGDTLSFYHLTTIESLGSVTLAGTPVTTHDNATISKMRSAYATMMAPPYSAHFVSVVHRQFASGLPAQVAIEGSIPAGVTALWSLAVLESTDNGGTVVRNSTFSDSYARAFMIKARDATFVGNTFRRSGGIHIGPEQVWLEGDPGIANVTVEENLFEEIGDPPSEIHEVPDAAARKITVKNNSGGTTGARPAK